MTDIIISSGVTSSGLVVSSGMTLKVLSGGTVVGTVVSGGDLDVAGQALSTTLEASSPYNDAGRVDVESGGYVSAISARSVTDAIVVHSGGSAAHAQIENQGSEEIEAGGFATDISVLPGGSAFFHSGASVAHVAVYSQFNLPPGRVFIDTGEVITDLQFSGGQEIFLDNVSSGQTHSGFQVVSLGSQTVFSGGVALGTKVGSVAAQYVYGLASGTVLEGFTTTFDSLQVVESGGVAIGTVLTSHAEEDILSGATASQVAIGGFSEVIVSSGGFLSGVVVSSGGTLIVSGLDGVADVTVLTGGTFQQLDSVLSGQTRSGGVLSGPGAQETVLAGGTTSDILVQSNAQQIVSSGGLSVDTVLTNGGQTIASGGQANATTVSSGGRQQVSGVASGAMIWTGGQQTVASTGSAASVFLQGGMQTVVGAAENTVLLGQASASGRQYVLGQTDNTVVSSGGEQRLVSSGAAHGSASLTTVLAGGAEIIDRFGLSVSLTVSSGGRLTVNSGGLASGVRIAAGGEAWVSSGGALQSATVDGAVHLGLGVAAGGLQLNSGALVEFSVVVSSGVISTTRVLSAVSGVTYKLDGGVVQSGGFLLLPSGGGAGADIVVSRGGTLEGPGSVSGTAELYGSATGVEVASHGVLTVESGATVRNLVLDAGATLVVMSGGAISGLTAHRGATIRFPGQSIASAAIDSAGLLTVSGLAGSSSLALAPANAGLGVALSSYGDAINGMPDYDNTVSGEEVTFVAGAPDDLYGNGRSQLLAQTQAGDVLVGQGSAGALAFSLVDELGSQWSFRGVGDFLGRGQAGYLLQNGAGTVILGYAGADRVIGGLGADWGFEATGDFLGIGQDQYLIHDANGALALGQVNAAFQTSYSLVGGLGPEWSFRGAGDFLGDGREQLLIQNDGGVFEVGEVSAGAMVFTGIGGVGAEWSVVETGDFLGDGRSDILLESAAGAVALGEFGSGGLAYTLVGGLGSEWRFVGAGDYAGTGHDSFLIENSGGTLVTGAVVSGHAQYAVLGKLGAGWTLQG